MTVLRSGAKYQNAIIPSDFNLQPGTRLVHVIGPLINAYLSCFKTLALNSPPGSALSILPHTSALVCLWGSVSSPGHCGELGLDTSCYDGSPDVQQHPVRHTHVTTTNGVARHR